LGEPLCVRCYQAGAQVLWNALTGRLWSRTTIYLYRTLAKAAGMTEAELRRTVRISFAKVAEYQKRGAVHFHAVIRLDARTPCGCPAWVLPPPEEFSAALLEEAVKEAAGTVAVACPTLDEDQGVTLVARWGSSCISATSPTTTAKTTSGCWPSRWPAMWPSTRPRAPRPWASP
jgi:hypothetical protein